MTGASKGIGRGIAVQLGEAGATVYITGRSVDKLKDCAEEIQKRGGKVSKTFLVLIQVQINKARFRPFQWLWTIQMMNK